jgi:hypothetical protein
MEVKSDPNKFETFAVTDIDVAYPGETVSVTLEDGKETYSVDADAIRVVRANGLRITFAAGHMHWYSIRSREQRRKVEEPKS